MNVTPGQHLCARALLGIIATVHYVVSNTACLSRLFQAIREALKALEEICSRCCARFDFYGIQSFVPLDEQVDFKSTCLPIVEQARLHAAMHAGLVDFGDDPAFEDCTAQGMEAKLLRFADTQQVTHQAAIEEMQLGCSDDLLTNVGMPSRYA